LPEPCDTFTVEILGKIYFRGYFGFVSKTGTTNIPFDRKLNLLFKFCLRHTEIQMRLSAQKNVSFQKRGKNGQSEINFVYFHLETLKIFVCEV